MIRRGCIDAVWLMVQVVQYGPVNALEFLRQARPLSDLGVTELADDFSRARAKERRIPS